MTIEVVPLTPTIGAEVRGTDLAAPLDESVMQTIEQALYDHLVLFFRDQDITPAQQIEFARWFGPFEYHPFAKPHPEYGEMTVLDQTTPERDGANSWHSDSSFMNGPRGDRYCGQCNSHRSVVTCAGPTCMPRTTPCPIA